VSALAASRADAIAGCVGVSGGDQRGELDVFASSPRATGTSAVCGLGGAGQGCSRCRGVVGGAGRGGGTSAVSTDRGRAALLRGSPGAGGGAPHAGRGGNGEGPDRPRNREPADRPRCGRA